MLTKNHINPFKNVKNIISQYPVSLCFKLILGIRAYFLAFTKEMGYMETKGIAFAQELWLAIFCFRIIWPGS
jgi:hypothetical protein